VPESRRSATRARRSPLAVGALAVALCAAGALLVLLPWYLTRPSASAAAPAGAWEALAQVRDPELDASIVDLGLVREVRALPGGRLEAVMILTSPACPYEGLIVGEARRALASTPGTRSARVVVDRRTRWTPELAIPELRRRLVLPAGAGS
jgi:metal-sulfur cluster biosynthetic enzyme